jgi:Zn-dependent protease with chaperone function
MPLEDAAPAGRLSMRRSSRRQEDVVHRFAPLTISGLLVCAVAGAAAAGDTWRVPAPAAPFQGQSTLELDGSSLSEVRELSKRQRRKGSLAPELLVLFADADGRGVPGARVKLELRVGKEKVRREGVTDDGGSFRFRPAGIPGLRRFDVDVAWDGGEKEIGVDLRPERDGAWGLEEARYRNAASGEWEGDCRNLFRLERDGERWVLLVRCPESLLDCREVDYGIDRKSATLAQLGSIGSRDVNEGDKNSFSPDDERKMGVEAASHFDAQFERVTDPAIHGYVERLVQSVVAASDAPDMPVNLRVVHTEGVNAFATAGGNVYVFTGLIDAAENEAQLAGVLAHEVSHVVARHVTEGASRQMKTQMWTLLASVGASAALDLDRQETENVIMASMVGAGVYGMRHGRRAETEADLLGSQYLWKAGWDPEAIARFFEVLERKGGASPPGWLSTHPTHERRVENGLHWSRAFLPAKDRWLVDTDEFRDVQRRVRALPPPSRRPSEEAEQQGLAPLLAGTGAFREVAVREWGDLLGSSVGR